MSDFVRVRDKETGHHYSVSRTRFDSAPDLFQELKQDATNSVGDPLPPKYKTTVSTEADKQAGKSANQKEN